MFVIFGGSFDPIHVGHLLIARDVMERLDATGVIFVPAYHAPLKEEHGASAEDRLEMVRIAIEGQENFFLEDYEVKRGGISYTVNTLEHMVSKLKGKPYLMLGADSFMRLHLWRLPERVLELANPLVVDREGKLDEVRAYVREKFPSLREGENLTLLKVRRIDISATEIRKRLREGKSIYCMVPDRVREYIERKVLYR